MAALNVEIMALDAGSDEHPFPQPTLHTVTFWINAFIPDPSLTPFVFHSPGASTGLSHIVAPSTVTGTPFSSLS